MSKLQFVIPLNTSLEPVTSRCNKVVRDPWKVFQPCSYNFRFDEDWDVQLPESPLPLLRVGVLAVWFDPCSNNWMAWCKRDASDFFRWNFFSFKSAWIFACAFQLSSTTFPCIFFAWFALCFWEKQRQNIEACVHNEHNKAELEHFGQKNDTGECCTT